MKVKITFLHNARPYISADEYSNIAFELSANALPNKGDILSIDGMSHHNGAFVVSHRVFHTNPKTGFESVELFVTTEGDFS